MASVNASRAAMAANVWKATQNARIIGFNEDGQACLWHGGVGFTVYDAVGDWNEVDYSTSGTLTAMTADERTSDEGYRAARGCMRARGFTVVE